jgi:energy-coupling factor transport system permease protein
MSETLTLFKLRDSPIHRLHPFTKLTLAGFMLVVGLSLPGSWGAYLLLILLVLPLAALARVAGDLALTAARVSLPFVISVFLIQGFLWPHGTPLVGVGPVSLKREGLAYAVTSSGRILTVISSFLWFAFTTRPDTLMISLAQRGLPAGLSYVVVSTLQIVPRFQARAAAILDAQRSRGLETEGSLLRRSRAILPLVAPLILSSLIDVEERALAVEARGFNHAGQKTSLVEIHSAGWEGPARWAVALAAIGLAALGWILR